MKTSAGQIALGCALPLVGGSLFWLTVKVEHWLVDQRMLLARGAIGIELVVFPICLVLIFVGAAILLRAPEQKWTVRIALAFATVGAGLWMIVRGFDAGAALLWAT